MKILVACEFSGIVTDAFNNQGCDAVSCDLLPTEGNPLTHIQDDVLNHLNRQWDMMIAFPPCTHLSSSGARWFKDKKEEQKEAIRFFLLLANADIPRKGIESSVGIMSTHFRKPDQYIHPWQFGHGETKKTCLWLKNLPLLKPTNIVSGREPRIHRMPPSPDRGKERSRFYQGIAEAMASQWSTLTRPDIVHGSPSRREPEVN